MDNCDLPKNKLYSVLGCKSSLHGWAMRQPLPPKDLMREEGITLSKF